MKQEKMQLTLSVSSVMDRRARKNPAEHNRVRLSKRARTYYDTPALNKLFIRIHGELRNKKLQLSQAISSDIKEHGKKTAETYGFVTTKTYNELMGEDTDKKTIWISEKTEKITIGADPEFVLLDEDGIAIYGDHVHAVKDDKWEKFGSDGPCAEIRPDPAEDPEQLVVNIRDMLTAAPDKMNQYEWIGGSTYRHPEMERRYPIGGHIHFGLPNIKGGAIETNRILQNRIVRILDEMIALPLVRIDTPLPKERRMGVGFGLGYGKFGEIKNYDFKFEWRVLSAIWMIHPEIANAVLAASKAVVEECWKRYEDNDMDESFMVSTNRDDNLLDSFECLDSETVRSLVNNSSIKDVPSSMVTEIGKKLKAMSTYSRYSSEINDFIKICKSKPYPEKKLFLKPGWLEDKAF